MKWHLKIQRAAIVGRGLREGQAGSIGEAMWNACEEMSEKTPGLLFSIDYLLLWVSCETSWMIRWCISEGSDRPWMQ